MSRTVFFLLFFGLASLATAAQNPSANSSAENLSHSGAVRNMEACDSFYGVTKSNCIQQRTADELRGDLNTLQSTTNSDGSGSQAKAVTIAPCDSLYGVTRSNCMQNLNLRWSMQELKMQKTVTMEPCDGLYGVTRTNCLQELGTQN